MTRGNAHELTGQVPQLLSCFRIHLIRNVDGTKVLTVDGTPTEYRVRVSPVLSSALARFDRQGHVHESARTPTDRLFFGQDVFRVGLVLVECTIITAVILVAKQSRRPHESG